MDEHNPLWILINTYPNKEWDWEEISTNKCITMKLIEDNLDEYHWNWRGICVNPNLTIEFVVKFHDKFPVYCWRDISAHHNITMSDIEKHPTLPWRSYGIDINPNITIEFVLKYHKINASVETYKTNLWYNSSDVWHHQWDSLSRSINIKDIESHPELPWNYHSISVNPTLDMNFVEAHIFQDWNWELISSHPNLTQTFLE